MTSGLGAGFVGGPGDGLGDGLGDGPTGEGPIGEGEGLIGPSVWAVMLATEKVYAVKADFPESSVSMRSKNSVVFAPVMESSMPATVTFWPAGIEMLYAATKLVDRRRLSMLMLRVTSIWLSSAPEVVAMAPFTASMKTVLPTSCWGSPPSMAKVTMPVIVVEPAIGVGVGSAIGVGDGSAIGVGVGSAIGVGVGSAIGVGVGSAIGLGSGLGMGLGMGLGLGSGLGTGLGSGLGTEGLGSGLGMGLGIGLGSGLGAEELGSGLGTGLGSGLGTGLGPGFNTPPPQPQQALKASMPALAKPLMFPTVEFHPLPSCPSLVHQVLLT